MSDRVDVWEETKMDVWATLKKGDVAKLKSKKVKWTFKQTGGVSKIAEQTADVSVTGEAVKATVDFPRVKDDEPNYEVRYDVEWIQKTTSKKYFGVWPRDFELKAVHKVDGAEQPCEKFIFQVKTETGVAPEDAALTTDANGVHQYLCRAKTLHEVKAVSPWVIESWKKKGPRKREVLVSRKKYTAELVQPTKAGSPHRQYVNLENPGDKPRHASKILVKVCAKGDLPKAPGDRLGMKGDEIFVQVVFGEKNSARNSPKPRLVIDGADVAAEPDKRTFKGKVKLKDNGDPAEFEVELGLAGGDRCEIKVGVTDACSDDAATLENWRKFRLELWQPTPDVVSSFCVFRNDKSVGLSPSQQKMLKDKMDKVFVEFDHAYANSGFYDGAADIGNAGAWRILDGAYFKKGAGKKVYVTTIDELDRIRLAKGPSEAAQPKDTLITAWADYLMGRPEGAAHTFSKKLTSGSEKHKDQYFFFPDDPTLGAQTPTVNAVVWAATDYKKTGRWHAITDDADPGGDRRYAQNVAQADFGRYVKFKDCHTLEISLPAREGVADDPGTWAKTVGSSVKIAVWVTLWRFWPGANAAGWHGYVLMGIDAGAATDGGIVSTFIHEMGHNMGQAYAGKAVGPTYGLPPGKAIPNVAFPAGVPGGVAYEGLQHTGLHCAFGISDGDRATAVTNGDISPYHKSAKCVMYGAGDMKSSSLKGFCEKCTPFVKAIDARDIREHWNEA